MDELKYIKGLVREYLDIEDCDNSKYSDEEFTLILMRQTEILNELKELCEYE